MNVLSKWRGNGTTSVNEGAAIKGSSNGPSEMSNGLVQYTEAGLLQRQAEEELAQERLFGMQNFGNTCYCNSVLQALYFCPPFREKVIGSNIASMQSAPVSPAGSSKLPMLSPSRGDTLPRPSSSSGKGRPVGTSAGKERIANALKWRDTPSSTEHQEETTVQSNGLQVNTSVNNANISNRVGPLTSVEASPSRNPNAQPTANYHASVNLNGTVTESTTLMSTMRDLFMAIASHTDRTGVVAPEAFVAQLRKENELFRSTMHQDAHEFLNYLLNAIAEDVERSTNLKAKDNAHGKTWVHDLFEGVLTSETKCLTCETVTSRDECFLDLSIDIEENTSLTSCLRQFSAREMLCSRNKFSCDTCCGLQEAEKRMKVKQLPGVLALHLKRFKWQEDVQRFTKLSYRVVFPFELRLFDTVDSAPDPDRLYSLWAIVVHIGTGAHHGHYVSLIKSCGRWIIFDDDTVSQIEESEIYKYFGDTPGMGTGYVLFYQAVDLQPPRPIPIELPPIPAPNTLSPPSVSPNTPSNLTNTKPQLSVNTSSGSSPNPEPSKYQPSPNGISPSPDRSGASNIPSPVKERRGFFNLANRRSISQRPTGWTAEDLATPATEQQSFLSPNSHTRSQTEGAEPVTPPPSGRSFMDVDTTDDESVSSNNLSQSQYSDTGLRAAPLSQPQHLDPNVKAPTKGTLGRLFGRTKSFKRPVSGGPADLPTPRSEDSPGGALEYLPQTSPVLNKKQMKEIEKQQKDDAKERQKREKEEAKRLKESAKR